MAESGLLASDYSNKPARPSTLRKYQKRTVKLDGLNILC